MDKKLQVAFVGFTPLFERSWVDTGILERLSKQIDIDGFVTYISDSHFPLQNIEILFRSHEKRWFSILRNIAWITYRHKSPSFLFWMERYYLSDYRWVQSQIPFVKRVAFYLNQMKDFVRKILQNRVSIWFLFPFKRIFFRVLQKLSPINSEITALFSRYDLVVIHSSSNEVFTPIIVKSLRLTGVPTLMTIENWDNLTSKQILFERPDYVTVMGSNDIRHAINIHGFEFTEIFPIGLPKFDFLRGYERKHKTQDSCLKLLYVGFHLPHDEVGFLNALYERLKETNLHFVLEYRPHPNARKRIDPGNLNRNIVIVEDLDIQGGSGLPNLNSQYLQDILRADLVLGPPTTLILECMVLNIPCFLDVTRDTKHRTTSAQSVARYLHLQDFYKAFSYLAFHDLTECLNMISEFKMSQTQSFGYPRLREFYFKGEPEFSSRMLQAITRIGLDR